MKALDRAIKVFNHVEDLIMVGLTMGFGLLIMWEILMRAIGQPNILWLEEFSRYMLVFTTMLGSSIAVKAEGHMAMDTLLVSLPKGAVRILKILINIVCTFTWAVVTWFSWKWMLRLQLIGTTVNSVSLKMWIIWVPIVIFSLSSTVRFAIQIYKSVAAAVKIEETGGTLV